MNRQQEREGNLIGSRRRNQSSRKAMPRLTLRIDFDGARAGWAGQDQADGIDRQARLDFRDRPADGNVVPARVVPR
jgi:hypothetical protein